VEHLSKSENIIHIPSTAAAIITPLQMHIWRHLLTNYHNQRLASFFISGLTNGFRIGYYSDIQLKSAKRNLPCALDHPKVVAEELSSNRLAGLYYIDCASHMHISRFGVIPKHHQPSKWRFIIDLSHPQSIALMMAFQNPYVHYPTSTSPLTQLSATSLTSAKELYWQRSTLSMLSNCFPYTRLITIY